MFEHAVEFMLGDSIFFEIDSLKTAPFAKAAVKLINPTWYAEYVPKDVLRNIATSRDGLEGQFRVTVILIENQDDQYDISQRMGSDLVLSQLSKYFEQSWGEIRAARMIHFDLAHRVIMFRVEFDSLNACRNLLKECRGKILLFEVWPMLYYPVYPLMFILIGICF